MPIDFGAAARRRTTAPPAIDGDRRAAALGDQPGRRDVPGRQAALLDEGIEAAVGDVRERQRRRAHRCARCGSPCARSGRVIAARPAVERHRDRRSRTASPCRRRRIGRPLSVAGPSAVAANDLVPGRVEDDPDGRRAVDDQPDRDAEDRDAVGVVHGAVERIDDPDPATPRGGRLARDRPVLPGLLGQDRVGRVARPDRVEDQRLGQVVRLGDDVAGALVVDLLEPLVAVHQHGPGPAARSSAKPSSSA